MAAFLAPALLSQLAGILGTTALGAGAFSMFGRGGGSSGKVSQSDILNAMQRDIDSSIATAIQAKVAGREAIEKGYEVAKREGESITREKIGARNLFGYEGAPSTPGQSLLLDFTRGLEADKAMALANLEGSTATTIANLKRSGLPYIAGLNTQEEESGFGDIIPAIANIAGMGYGMQRQTEQDALMKNILEQFGGVPSSAESLEG